MKKTEMTITAKIQFLPNNQLEVEMLQATMRQYQKACNYVSTVIYDTKIFSQAKLHTMTYHILRETYNLKSQMAQSVLKTVLARYKSAKTNGHKFTRIKFRRYEYDLVWNRDYSLNGEQSVFSINTIDSPKRLKMAFEMQGMKHYFDGTWKFGTAKLVNKYGKWFLHIPMTTLIDVPELKNVQNIVGIDLGINFIATSYDSRGKVTFFDGHATKHQRGRYKTIRQQLQVKQTPAARRKLKAIGNRENRWMTDINHTVTKALVEQYGENTLFVIEDLSGVRNATQRVRVKDRYVNVSWSFFQFRTMLEYKAKMHGATVIAVDPRYTSQMCPKCGHTHKGNRDKKRHLFKCLTCGYTSNDDRIAAMNLHRKGIEYIGAVTNPVDSTDNSESK